MAFPSRRKGPAEWTLNYGRKRLGLELAGLKLDGMTHPQTTGGNIPSGAISTVMGEGLYKYISIAIMVDRNSTTLMRQGTPRAFNCRIRTSHERARLGFF